MEDKEHFTKKELEDLLREQKEEIISEIGDELEKVRQYASFSAMLGPLAMFFPRSNVAKVRFISNKENEIKGFGTLCKSGYAIDSYGNGVYGLTSEKQLKLLDKLKIPYKLVD
nr:hypothetical protein [Candidatus Woesearchaeota archaeon]